VTGRSGNVKLRRCVIALRERGIALTSVGVRLPEMLMASFFEALMLFLNLAWYVMIAQIILSWLISFQVLNLRQPQVAQIWYGLNRVLEPLYAPIRRFLPATPGLDLAPLVAFVVLLILQRVLINNAGFFYGY
jgi:YggT family protein